tara:strand:- start:1328 stop:1807 length:480 start_codon:yes stop_codon:yes gene_type:complete
VIDKRVFYTGSSALLILGVCLAAQGCDLQKMVHFDVPGDVQTAISVEENPTLSDADYVWNRWQSWVQLNSEQLSRGIENSKERVSMIESVTAMGIGALGEVSNSFPGGALLFSGLSLATGLFIKRPKEDKIVAKEKEDSYNAGLEKGKELAKTIEEVIS